jgi:hypothetical protein
VRGWQRTRSYKSTGTLSWLFYLTTFGSSTALFAQPPTSEHRIQRINVEMIDHLSLDDLAAGERALKSLGQANRSSCAGQQPGSLVPCNWHVPVPKALQRTAPYREFDSVSGIYDPPYQPFALSLVQDRLAFASFVRLSEAMNGDAVFVNLRRYADTGQLINCVAIDSVSDHPGARIPENIASVTRIFANSWLQGGPQREKIPKEGQSCLAVVPSLKQNDVQFQMVCQVLLIHDLAGPPIGCVPVSASTGSGDWLLAHTGMYFVQLADNGKPDFKFNLFYSRGSRVLSLDSSPTIKTEDMLSAAERAIHAKPLSLQTAVTRYILGISPRRTSPVLLGGWNEEVTIRIDLESQTTTDTTGKTVNTTSQFEVSTSVLVNRQKDSKPTDWHQPSPEQTKAWSDSIRMRLTEELRHLCLNPQRRDDYSLTCK